MGITLSTTPNRSYFGFIDIIMGFFLNAFARRLFRDFWIGGIISDLFDLDHLIPLIAKGLPQRITTSGMEAVESAISRFGFWFVVFASLSFHLFFDDDVSVNCSLIGAFLNWFTTTIEPVLY